MSQIIMVKINHASCSGTYVSPPNTKYQSTMISGNSGIVSFESLLSELLLPYNNKIVHINYKFFNNLDAIDKAFESAKEHNKNVSLSRKFGKLNVEHQNRSSDFDEWFESSIKMTEFEINRSGKAKNMNKPLSKIDFNELCKKKAGKILFLEIRQA